MSWPRSSPAPVSAAVPTRRWHSARQRAAGRVRVPGPGDRRRGSGAASLRAALPGPGCPGRPRGHAAAGGSRPHGPRGARPKAPVTPQQAPLEVRDPRRLGDDHPRRRVHLDRNQRVCKRAQEDPRQGRHGLRARERQQDLYVGADHGPRQRGEARPRCPRVDDPSEGPDRGKGDRPPAARPHERAARLLPQRQDRPGAAPRPRPQMDGAGLVPLRRQADLSRREGVVLLEHELRAARARRRSGRRPTAERATAQPVPRPARARPYLRTDRRAARRPDRPGLPGHGFPEQARLLRPVGRQQDHPLHVGRDRGPGCRFDGGLVIGCRALGTGPVRRRGPASGDGPRHGR